MVPDVSCSSRHNNALINEGEIIAATRAIPLIISEKSLNKAEKIARSAGGIFSVKKLSNPETGLIITGNEVYTGKIEDEFAPLIKKSLIFLAAPSRRPFLLLMTRMKLLKESSDFSKKDMSLFLCQEE